MPDRVAIVSVSLVSVLVTGCSSPEAEPAQTNDATQTSSESSTESETESETGTNLAGCTLLDYEVVEHYPLSSWQCQAINDEQVFQSKAEVEDWLATTCVDENGCWPCDGPPNVNWSKHTVLLGVGHAPQGSEGQFLWNIYDCGDHVEAHYLFAVDGPELAFIQASEAVRIDKIEVPVEFYGTFEWTCDYC
jgi:hypothetical protein